jgi:hypothetical protein
VFVGEELLTFGFGEWFGHVGSNSAGRRAIPVTPPHQSPGSGLVCAHGVHP